MLGTEAPAHVASGRPVHAGVRWQRASTCDAVSIVRSMSAGKMSQDIGRPITAGAMRSVLAYLARTYGGADGYPTTACAVTSTELKSIRRNLLKDDE